MITFFSTNKKTKELTPEELVKKVSSLEQRLQEMTRELNELRQGLKKAVAKIGVVRFNAFKEVGGDQSFSIALLDEEHNGVIVTSYYGRELNRVYAKPVRNGVADHELSAEEKEAIAQAMGQENPKQK